MSWADLLTGVVAGLVATVVWTLLTWDQRRRRLKRDFAPLEGTYSVTRKLAADQEPETVVIEVEKSTLVVRFTGLSAGETVTGEIAMNEQLPRSGKGHYWHVRGEAQMWGFWALQVKDVNTLLVHTTYASHKQPVPVVSGFVWSRIGWH